MPARKIVSMFSRTKRVARSSARSMTAPTGVPSSTQPAISAEIESPMSNSKSGQRTFSRPSRLPGDVVGAEPFDVRARRRRRIARQPQHASGSRGRKRQPPGQPDHCEASTYNASSRDQLRRRTQLPGILKLFFTTSFRVLVTRCGGIIKIWLTFEAAEQRRARAEKLPRPLVSIGRYERRAREIDIAQRRRSCSALSA